MMARDCRPPLNRARPAARLPGAAAGGYDEKTSTSTLASPFFLAASAGVPGRRAWTTGRCTRPASGRARSTRATTTSRPARARPPPTATHRALVAPSAALGLDRLPVRELAELAERLARRPPSRCPAPFQAWAGAGACTPDAAHAAARARPRAVGLEVAAHAMRRPTDSTASRRSSSRLGGARRSRRSSIRPGGRRGRRWQVRAGGFRSSCTCRSSMRPGGRGSLAGGARWPRLRVCFVALAGPGAAPWRASSGARRRPPAADPPDFRRDLELRRAGDRRRWPAPCIDVICDGSDRPYAATSACPDLGAAALGRRAGSVILPASSRPIPGGPV